MTDKINGVSIDILKNIDKTLRLGMTENNTDHIDYKALYEQIAHEYEEYRVRTARIKLAAFSMEAFKMGIQYVVKNPYFWLGYFTALVSFLIIKLFNLMEN